MARFRKGTMDHDGDGRKGGSMAKSTRKTSTAAAKEQQAALKAEALAMTGTVDPQSGQSMTHPDDAPSTSQVKAARKEALETQLAAADEKGAPSSEDIRDATLSRAIRGY